MLKMHSKLPKISIVIPIKPRQKVKGFLNRFAKIDYPTKNIEIIAALGNQPSRQRNLAVKQALGEIIYFLDNDSFPKRCSLRTGISRFLTNKKVVAVGGPALTQPIASDLEKAFGFIQGSLFGGFYTRYRHRAIGKKARKVKGEELILCNLLLLKTAYTNVGGLNEILYPNEENELLRRLNKKNAVFLYDPKMIIFRRRKTTLMGLAKQNFNYGRGRVEHFFWNLLPWDLFFIVPSLFVFYLLSLIFYQPLWYLTPLILYFILATAASFPFLQKTRKPLWLGTFPILFLVNHTSYGLGFLLGFVKRLSILAAGEPRAEPVKVTKLKTFGENFSHD